MSNNPLVTVITPVYNGAAYLEECITSVQRQTYENWRYKIIDNQSTDGSLEIARRYAESDPRIEVLRNERFLDLMDNWNHAVSQLDDEAKYCKIVHADDWLFPECLTDMVGLAEDNPGVGIVSAYRLEEDRPGLGRLPFGQTVTSGEEICRSEFERRVFVFGSPSNILMRADLVRKHQPFYDTDLLHADKDAALRLLLESDLGFVFKILTFTRRHNESQTSKSILFNTKKSEDLLLLKRYGPLLYSKQQAEQLLAERLRNHYRFLARSVFERKGKAFWDYQRDILKRLGSPLHYGKLIQAVFIEGLNVKETLKALRH
ncbi:MAG TPA: glycosyltransferase family 2 protein [Chromatiales bacterium]|nr:glycosyltransferase family 2 protein [Chromatiales bacterium]